MISLGRTYRLQGCPPAHEASADPPKLYMQSHIAKVGLTA